MKGKDYWIRWAKAAGIRALRTFAQGCLSTLTATALLSEIEWNVTISAGVLAAIISILMSIAGLPEVDEEENE